MALLSDQAMINQQQKHQTNKQTKQFQFFYHFIFPVWFKNKVETENRKKCLCMRVDHELQKGFLNLTKTKGKTE